MMTLDDDDFEDDDFDDDEEDFDGPDEDVDPDGWVGEVVGPWGKF